MENLPDDVLISVLHFASLQPKDVFCSYPATCRRWNDILAATRTVPDSDDPVPARDASAAADTGAGTRHTGDGTDGEATAKIWKDLVRLHHPQVMEGLLLNHSNSSKANHPDESWSRMIRRKTGSGTYKEEDGKLRASTTRTTSVDASKLCWREILRALERNARLRPAFERDEQQLDIFRPRFFDHAGGGGPSDVYTPPQLDSYKFFVKVADERGRGDSSASKDHDYFVFAANAKFRTCEYNIDCDDSDVAASEAEVVELDLVEPEDGFVLSAATNVVVEVCRSGVSGQCIDDQGGKATLFQWVRSTSSGPRQELQSCRFYDYAKFRALNHCVRERNPIRNMQSYKGFACCVPSARVDVAASLSSQQSGSGKIKKIILKMEWADPSLNEYLAMPSEDTLKLLDKGLDYNGDCSSPHHAKDSNDVVLNSGRIAMVVSSFLNPIPPRPLDSYSFLVQYSLAEDAIATGAVVPSTPANGRQTLFTVYSYHPGTSVSVETADFSPFCPSKLVFDVPPHCHNLLPPDPYQSEWELERTRAIPFDEFTSIAVYVIQKDTGRQAKLYEGGACGTCEDRWGSSRKFFTMEEYNDLPLFAATSYFSIPHRHDMNHNGLPKVSGELYHEPKESMHSNEWSGVERGKEQEETKPTLFKICLTWTWQKKDGSSTGIPARERDLLVFLERGLCFK